VRILIATPVPRQREAGAAGVVFNHARELEKRGHTVDCWFLDDVLPGRAGLGRFAGLLFALRVAKRILKDRQAYDVVNLHAPSGCAYGLCRKFLRPKGAPPYVFTMHGSEEWISYVMTREYRLGRAENYGWKNRLWHRVYHQNMFDFSIRTTDYGTVVNRAACVVAQITYGGAPGRICYIPNGAEESFFMPRDYGARQTPRLLFAGSWIDRKGIHYLTEAFGLFCSKLPDITLTVAGCMLPEAKIASSFAPEVRDRVRVIPMIKRPDMPALYAEHDILVFPSLAEGMPLTLLEAMATGMPIIASDAPGMADIVEDEFSGLLVQPADTNELAAAMERMCRSADLRLQLGQAAQQTARRYTWPIVTQKLERVLLLAAALPGALN
jgi:glycosyltransferase involved in cell wall biosynthesis